MNKKDARVVLILSVIMLIIGIILKMFFGPVPYGLDKAFISAGILPGAASLGSLIDLKMRSYTDENKEKEMAELNARVKEVPTYRIITVALQLLFMVVMFIVSIQDMPITMIAILFVIFVFIAVIASFKIRSIEREIKKEIKSSGA